MFCKNCGKEIHDTATFCSGCGTKVGSGVNIDIKAYKEKAKQLGSNIGSAVSKAGSGEFAASSPFKEKSVLAFLAALVLNIILCFVGTIKYDLLFVSGTSSAMEAYKVFYDLSGEELYKVFRVMLVVGVIAVIGTALLFLALLLTDNKHAKKGLKSVNIAVIVNNLIQIALTVLLLVAMNSEYSGVVKLTFAGYLLILLGVLTPVLGGMAKKAFKAKRVQAAIPVMQAQVQQNRDDVSFSSPSYPQAPVQPERFASAPDRQPIAQAVPEWTPLAPSYQILALHQCGECKRCGRNVEELYKFILNKDGSKKYAIVCESCADYLQKCCDEEQV